MILRALDPAAAEHRHEILADETEVDVGRSPECGVVLPAKSVSRVHARFRRSGTEWTLEDLGSSNGTAVNGTPVHAPVPVRPGDRVRFGSLEFMLEAPPAAASASESETLLAPPDRAAAAPSEAVVEPPAAAARPVVVPSPPSVSPSQRERTSPATPSPSKPARSEPEAPSGSPPPFELALIAGGAYVLVVAAGLLLRWLLG